MMVLQEIVLVPNYVEIEGRKEREFLSSTEKISPSPPVCPYQPLVPFPKRKHGLSFPSLSYIHEIPRHTEEDLCY